MRVCVLVVTSLYLFKPFSLCHVYHGKFKGQPLICFITFLPVYAPEWSKQVLLFFYVFVSVCMMSVRGCPWKPEEGISFLGARVAEVNCLLWVLG